jgi:hypothetical protein
VADMSIGLLCWTDIKKYQPGEYAEGRAEYGQVVGEAVKARKQGSKLPAVFQLPGVDGIP